MRKNPFLLYKVVIAISLLLLFASCASDNRRTLINSVTGPVKVSPGEIWLSHEHLLVDFIGADSIDSKRWNHDSVLDATLNYLEELKSHNVKYFVDATPVYLGRDVLLLEKISKRTGLIM